MASSSAADGAEGNGSTAAATSDADVGTGSTSAATGEADVLEMSKATPSADDGAAPNGSTPAAAGEADVPEPIKASSPGADCAAGDSSTAKAAGETYDSASKDGVCSRRDFLLHVRQEILDETGLLALPLCLLLLVLFSGVVMGHERSVERQSIRSAIRDDILENANYDFLLDVGWNGVVGSGVAVGFKNYENVIQPFDVNNFLRQGYFPNMIWTSDVANETTRSYLQYNQIIGGIRILTQTMDESVENCRNEALARIMNTSCMATPTNDPQTEGFDDLAFMPDGDETTLWSAGPNFDPKAVLSAKWFMLSESEEQHKAQLDMMQASGGVGGLPFFNRQVRHVIATMLVWNADLRLICLVEVNFFFARTGRVWPLLRIKTIDPDPFRRRADSGFVGVWDTIWLLCLLWNFARDFYWLAVCWRRVGLKNLHTHLPHRPVWYFLDAVGLFLGFILIFTYWDYWRRVTGIREELLHMYANNLQSDQATLELFFAKVEEACHSSSSVYLTVLLIYPVSLLLRLGLAFSGQPRLSVVSRTISAAFTDLYHYLVVFGSFHMTFTCLAVTIFGRELEQFSTLSRAMQSCTRMLFGDTDWDDLQAAGFVRATSFFFCFHALMVMIMFNILLAIIMDAYEVVKEDLSAKGDGSAPLTLVEQGLQVCDRTYRNWRHERVSLNFIWIKCFEAYGPSGFDDEPLTLDELKKVIPEMPESQAERLFARTQGLYNSKDGEEESEEVGLSEEVDKLQVKIARISDKVQSPLHRPGDAAAKDGAPIDVKHLQMVLPADVAEFQGSHAETLDLGDVEKMLRYCEWLARDAHPAVFHATQLALTLASQKVEAANPVATS